MSHLQPTGADSPRSHNVTRQIHRLGLHSRSPSPAKRRALSDEIAETPSPTKRAKPSHPDERIAVPDSPAFIDRLKAEISPEAKLKTASGSESEFETETDSEIDRTALTWQDEEITGHEIDADPADDGEGINGLGFRPTPRIAAQRVMKRRQQVSEYKARELSEARSLRMARRKEKEGKGVPGSGGVDEKASKRSVRFVE